VTGGLDGLVTLSWTMPAGAIAFSTVLGAGLALVGLRGGKGIAVAAAAGRRTAGASQAGQRLQWSLVTAQVMLAVTLVTGATLLIRSVEHMLDVELGLRPQGAVTADLYLGSRTPSERRDVFGAVTERVAAMEGVQAAGTIMRLPLRERGFQGGVWLEDRPDLRDNLAPNAYYRTISPGTFEALGTRILRGRAFTDADRLDATPVTIVSAGFAELAWPGEDALGKRLAPVGFEGDVWATVVGIVEDIRYEGATEDPPEAVYRPVAQTRPYPGTVLLARAPDRDPGALLAAIRREAAAVDATVAIDRTATLDQVLQASMAQPLRLRFFLGLFGAVALLLGMVGVYGVVSYAVSRRTREYGVRLALGAEPRGLTRAVVRRGMAPVMLGIAAGIVLALLSARTLSGFLFGVVAFDPLSFASAALLLLAAGAEAAVAPALRAGRVDPVRALRAE
jgi:predicted permease